MFELAAFVSSSAVIKFAPLFVELSVGLFFSFFWLGSVLLKVLKCFQMPGAIGLAVVIILIGPFGVQQLRRNMRGKDGLLDALLHFDVGSSSCGVAFDSDYIDEAIDEWYGSKIEFNLFVQTAVLEKVRSQICKGLKYSYALLCFFPSICYKMDYIAAMVYSGLPPFAIFIEAVQQAVDALAVGPMFVYLVFFLCERYKGDVNESRSCRCFWCISLTLIPLVGCSITNGALVVCQFITAGPFIGLGLSALYVALAIWLWKPLSVEQEITMSNENIERVRKVALTRDHGD